MNLYDEFFFVTEPNSSEPKFFFLSFPKIHVKIWFSQFFLYIQKTSHGANGPTYSCARQFGRTHRVSDCLSRSNQQSSRNNVHRPATRFTQNIYVKSVSSVGYTSRSAVSTGCCIHLQPVYCSRLLKCTWHLNPILTELWTLCWHNTFNLTFRSASSYTLICNAGR